VRLIKGNGGSRYVLWMLDIREAMVPENCFLVSWVLLKFSHLRSWQWNNNSFQMEKLLQPNVWLDAANQVFYSYGLAFGSIISFGSYNPPDKNVVKDVYMISACNAFTAVYACAVVFAILGFKAQHLFEKCMQQWVF